MKTAAFRKRRLGIRAKFILLVGVVLVLVFSTLSLYLAVTGRQALHHNLEENAKVFATLATEPIGAAFVLYKDSGTVNIDRELQQQSLLNQDITNISVVSVDGKVMYQMHDQTLLVTAAQASSFEAVYVEDGSGSLETIIYPYIENYGGRRYSMVYSISSHRIDVALRRATMSVVFLSAVSLATTLGMVYFFVYSWLIKKVRRLSAQARVISRGNLDQEITVTGDDEIGDLARSVAAMSAALKTDIEKLRELDRAKTEFMTITSHNLRTPLTIIRGYLEAAESYDSVDQMKAALKEIAAGSQRLNVFAEDVITISRLELGEQVSVGMPIDIHELVNDIVDDAIELAKLKGVYITKDIQPVSGTISASRPYLRTAIWNLVDNAIKFTDQGGAVIISLHQVDDKAMIVVQDSGVGIAPEEMPRLFTKFHRATQMLTYDYEGIGIGLYTVKKIIEQLGGTISVDSKEHKGSIFTICLRLDRR